MSCTESCFKSTFTLEGAYSNIIKISAVFLIFHACFVRSVNSTMLCQPHKLNPGTPKTSLEKKSHNESITHDSNPHREKECSRAWSQWIRRRIDVASFWWETRITGRAWSASESVPMHPIHKQIRQLDTKLNRVCYIGSVSWGSNCWYYTPPEPQSRLTNTVNQTVSWRTDDPVFDDRNWRSDEVVYVQVVGRNGMCGDRYEAVQTCRFWLYKDQRRTRWRWIRCETSESVAVTVKGKRQIGCKCNSCFVARMCANFWILDGRREGVRGRACSGRSLELHVVVAADGISWIACGLGGF